MNSRKEYVKLWLSYETYFQSYTPEEVGRLVLAMLHYKDTGELPAFQGNERFIWPAVQRDIDEAQAAQDSAAELSREHGRRGGRPRKPSFEDTEPLENPPGFSETQKTLRTKDKDIDKGHCQGQGQGQGQGSACMAEKFAAADRLLAQIISDAKREAAQREEELFP